VVCGVQQPVAILRLLLLGKSITSITSIYISHVAAWSITSIYLSHVAAWSITSIYLSHVAACFQSTTYNNIITYISILDVCSITLQIMSCT